MKCIFTYQASIGIILISRIGHIFPFLASLIFKFSVSYSFILHGVAILYQDNCLPEE